MNIRMVCIDKLDQLIDTTEEKLASYRLLFQKQEDPFAQLYLGTAAARHGQGHGGTASRGSERGIRVSGMRCRLQLSSERH